VAAQDCRERLIDTTLDVCVRCGHEATTVEQIAAAADVTPADFSRYFATTDAAIMSVVDDLLHATAAALKDVEAETSPERALLTATTEAVRAIIDGRGVITRERLIAMAKVVTANSSLRKQASLARKRILSQALAVRMGVAAENRRVRQAITMWSAIAAGAYVGGRSMADHYDPRDDDRLIERMIAELAATFADVMGNDPSGPGGGAA
jgi:AcrR family transcriptional regulator